MSRREPEHVIDDAPLLSLGDFEKSRRFLRLFPGLAEIGGTKDGRTQMAGTAGYEHRESVSRIHDQMVHDVAEQDRRGQFPGPAGPIAAQEKGALARADEQCDSACGGLESGLRVRCHCVLLVRYSFHGFQ